MSRARARPAARPRRRPRRRRRRRASAASRRSTTRGARPSDSSSARSSWGWRPSARASVSICCSPPEMSPALRPSSWLELGEQRRARSRRATPASRRLSATVRRAHRRALLGHERGARRRAAVQRLPDCASVPAHVAGQRAAARRRGRGAWCVLPAPLAPSNARTSPRRTVEVEVAYRGLVAVPAPRARRRRGALRRCPPTPRGRRVGAAATPSSPR